MRKYFLSFLLILLSATACSTKKYYDQPLTIPTEKPKKVEKITEPVKPPSIVVNNKDLEILEKMNTAVESFVLKNDPKAFNTLCKDIRFDCFVDDQPFPKKKKRLVRKVPPYATGSKMGLQGDKRVQIKYDFFP